MSNTITLRGIGGGMLTKQNALFVTVRQTPKIKEGNRFQGNSFVLGYNLTICDE